MRFSWIQDFRFPGAGARGGLAQSPALRGGSAWSRPYCQHRQRQPFQSPGLKAQQKERKPNRAGVTKEQGSLEPWGTQRVGHHTQDTPRGHSAGGLEHPVWGTLHGAPRVGYGTTGRPAWGTLHGAQRVGHPAENAARGGHATWDTVCGPCHIEQPSWDTADGASCTGRGTWVTLRGALNLRMVKVGQTTKISQSSHQPVPTVAVSPPRVGHNGWSTLYGAQHIGHLT